MASFTASIEQKIGDVVGQRSSNEELHREVVKTFRILEFVGFLGENPSLREDVPHGAGEGLKPVAWRCRAYVDRIVKEEMTFIQRVVGPLELNRAASVLLKQLRNVVGSRRYWGFQDRLRAHLTYLSESRTRMTFRRSRVEERTTASMRLLRYVPP